MNNSIAKQIARELRQKTWVPPKPGQRWTQTRGKRKQTRQVFRVDDLGNVEYAIIS